MLTSQLLSTVLSLSGLVACTDILFQGGTIVTWNDATQRVDTLPDTSILVSGNKIVSIFPASSNSSAPSSNTTIIDAKGKIITPGFIDTHRHLWQTAFKTIASNTTLAEYFSRYGEFTAAGTVYTPEDVYYGQTTGIYESLNAGVTSILDHAHHTWSVKTSLAGWKASDDSGARVFWCYTFHNLTNGFERAAQYQNYRDIVDSAEAKDENRPATVGIAYDGISIDPPSEVRKVTQIAADTNASVVTLHSLAGPWGFDNGPATVHKYGFLNTSIPVVISHASYMSFDDVQLLRSTNQYISITPESEMHYGHGHLVSHLIQDQASLGIDSHFTYSADIVTQARMWLQSVRLLFAKQKLDNWQINANNPMSVAQAFYLATRAGALALRRNDIGIIAEGAKADLVVFDGDSPNMLGWADAVAAVMLHSNVGDVQHVLVNGEFKKRDGKLVMGEGQEGWDVIKSKFLQSARRIQAIWAEMPHPVFEGAFQSGALISTAETADTLRGDGTGY